MKYEANCKALIRENLRLRKLLRWIDTRCHKVLFGVGLGYVVPEKFYLHICEAIDSELKGRPRR